MHLVPFACMLLTNPKHFFFQSVLINFSPQCVDSRQSRIKGKEIQ